MPGFGHQVPPPEVSDEKTLNIIEDMLDCDYGHQVPSITAKTEIDACMMISIDGPQVPDMSNLDTECYLEDNES